MGKYTIGRAQYAAEAPPDPPGGGVDELPLLTEANFTWDNYFIAADHGVGSYSFAGGRYGLMYRPATDTFLSMGAVATVISGTPRKYLGEFTNRPTNGSNTSSLAVTHQERFGADWSLASGGSATDFRFGGNLVHNGRLITSGFNKYRASGPYAGTPTHFVSDEDLSVAGYTGPWTADMTIGSPGGTEKVAYINGFQGHIPTEWQDAFGAPCFCGNYGFSTVGQGSAGHTFGVYDPDDIGVIDPFPVRMCRYVPTTADMVGSTWNTQSELFNALSWNMGCQFIPGTRTIVMSQSQGTGVPTYGGGGYQNIDGIWVWRIHLYDALDMLDGLNDVVSKPAIQPYESFTVDEATVNANYYDSVRSLAMDTVNNPVGTIARLYADVHKQGESAKIHAINISL